MEDIRTEKISVNMTPALLARLDRYARDHVWPRSTAAAVLIETALDANDHDHDQETR